MFFLRAIYGLLVTRWAGGGFGANWLRDKVEARYGKFWGSMAGRAPEILFAIPIGYASAVMFDGGFLHGLIAAVWSYLFMEIGHGNFYHDGTSPIGRVRSDGWVAVDRPGSLEIYTGLHWLLPKLGIASRSKWYCRILMALKWALIWLPLGWYAPAFAIIGAVSYALSFRYTPIDHPETSGSGLAEMISGLSSFALLALIMGA